MKLAKKSAMPVLILFLVAAAVGKDPARIEDHPAARFFETLLRIPEAVQVLQASSHNKTGLNGDEDWPQYVDANGEEVIFDAAGPGCVKSMWGTNFDPDALIRFYFDGEKNPRYQTGIVDFYKGALPEFPQPLVSYERRGRYGDIPYAGNSFVPIPFEKSLKITVKGKAHFYHILYEKYPYPAPVRSFSGGEKRDHLLAAFSHNVDVRNQDLERIEFTMEKGLESGGTVVLFSAERKAGIIREIVLEGDGSEDFFQRARLRMRWDSAHRFQVVAPVGLFFGTAVKADDMRSLPLDVEKLADGRVRLRCRFPMPFWKDAEIQVVNLSQRKLGPITALISVGTNSVPEDQGTYFTTMVHEGETTYGHDWLFYDGRGSGWYAGTVQSMQYEHYCEGDEHFTLDDAVSPQINGTGSEDYYLACFWPNLDFDLPFGCVSGDVAVEGGGYLSGFYDRPSSYSRFHLEAPIPFYAGISAKIQHGGLSQILSLYRSLAFVYIRRRPRLVLTDTLDVGNAGSEKAHGYGASGRAPVETLQARPEGDFFETSEEEDGRYHDGGTIRITFSVDPANKGVRIRRLLDQDVPCQGADVYVDGTFAGTWYWGYRNEHLRWFEQDFDIHPRFTEGKESLEIRLNVLSSPGIRIPGPGPQPRHPSARFTDFVYSVFCFK